MARNISVLTLSTIVPASLGSFRVQTYCVNTPAAALPTCGRIQPPSAVYPRAAVDEWGAALFGNLALMTRREKWPLLRLKRPWIIFYYLCFSLKTVETPGRIKDWKRCVIGSGVVFHFHPSFDWSTFLLTHFSLFPFFLFLFYPHPTSTFLPNFTTTSSTQ